MARFRCLECSVSLRENEISEDALLCPSCGGHLEEEQDKKIKIACPNCHFTQVVSMLDLPPKAINATCPKCNNKFNLKDNISSPNKIGPPKSTVDVVMGCLVKIWIFIFAIVMIAITVIYAMFHNFGDGSGR